MNTPTNSYVARLKLDFDPFEIKAASKDFFPGGGRQELLEQLAAIARTSGSVLAVTGELGVGKSTLAQALVRKLGKEAVCAHVQATLFMNKDQFLELILADLDLADAQSGDPFDALSAYANDLALSARSLVLVIDDAQELASDVHATIAKLMRRNSGGGFSVIMLGEAQLEGLLQRGLPTALSQQVEYREFPLFSREDSEEYARFKLARAGYRKPLPLDGGELGNVHNASAGVPGKLNAQLASALNRAAETAAPAAVAATSNGSVLKLGKSYWLAAGSLVMALLVVVLWPATAPDSGRSAGGQPIPVQVGRGSQSTASDATATAPVARQSAVETNTVAVADDNAERQQGDSVIEADAVISEAVPAAVEPRSATPSDEPVSAPQPAVAEQFTAFERSLLAASPDSFTVQLLGSRSVDSIRRFLAEHNDLSGSGYFETRYQGQPWYVVVAGNFSQRGGAEAAIESMSADVRQLQPWVRSMRDIQSGLRELHRIP